MIQIRHFWGEVLDDLKLVPKQPRADYGHLTDFAGLDSFQKGEIGFEDYLDGLGAFLGGLPREDCRRVHAHILLAEYPESEAIVTDLKSRGIGVGCLSNTNEPHWRECVESGRFPVCAAFDRLVTSFELELNKPDPAIYREFERAMGWQGHEILFFDDALVNLDSAADCGWSVVLIDPQGDVGGQIRKGLAEFFGDESFLIRASN